MSSVLAVQPEVVEILNRLLSKDPQTITNLVMNRFTANEQLANDEAIVVVQTNNMVGTLGIINGLFYKSDWIIVAYYNSLTKLVVEFKLMNKENLGDYQWM